MILAIILKILFFLGRYTFLERISFNTHILFKTNFFFHILTTNGQENEFLYPKSFSLDPIEYTSWVGFLKNWFFFMILVFVLKLLFFLGRHIFLGKICLHGHISFQIFQWFLSFKFESTKKVSFSNEKWILNTSNLQSHWKFCNQNSWRSFPH